MSQPRIIVLAVLVLSAALPVGSALADDICRRPCQIYVPQKGTSDPTASGCHDLIDNLSGTCSISLWDLQSNDGVEIIVHSTPRPNQELDHANRPHIWINLG